MRIRSFTLDLEDNRFPGTPSRVTHNMDRILEFLDARRVTATVFVVGSLASEQPKLIEQIAQAGHEIGFHSEHHEYLRELSPRVVVDTCRAGRARLEDLTGRPVLGYRAPYFSLTRDVPWAPRAIEDAGFVYSSSVVPAPNPVAGFPGAPSTPFRWHGTLPEFPCPVGGVARLRVPFAGGVYLRVLPLVVIRALLQRQPDDALPWIYCHPYDFDVETRFTRMPGTRWWETVILGLNRGQMFSRLDSLLVDAAVAPLGEAATSAEYVAGLPAFEP
jgi:polysaccharide deacetylase family protein (PEP-CTERM system associated)